MMKRREILKMGGSSLALAGLGVTASVQAASKGAEAAATNGYRWSRAGASALVGQQFWVNDPKQGAVSLKLEAVRATAKPPVALAGAPASEQFSLYFAGTAGAGLAAGSYEFDHGSIGRFMLYLTPDKKRTGANVYRADFNLLA